MKINLKDSKGITLIVLIITIIVMSILATISIKYGLSSINTTKDSVIESDLKMVQQSLVQQYAKAKVLNDTGKVLDENDENDNQPKEFFGVPCDEDDLKILLNDYPNLELLNISKNNENISYSVDKTYDNIYYKVDSDDLKNLGIDSKGGQEYLVNYSTGEVLDISNVKYDNGDYAYINGLGEELEISKEEFTDTPINITLYEELSSNPGGYKFKIKVTDELAKITPEEGKDYSNDEDDFNKNDIQKKNAIIKIGDEEKRWNDIKNDITITKIIETDSSLSIGEYYVYEIFINKSVIPSDNPIVTLIINPDSIKDDAGYSNEKKEIVTSLSPVNTDAEFTFELGNVEYQTNNENLPKRVSIK